MVVWNSGNECDVFPGYNFSITYSSCGMLSMELNPIAWSLGGDL